MGIKLKADEEWHAIDIDEICRLFETTKEGTEVRQRNMAAAVKAVAGPLGHCLANTARVVARQSVPWAHRRTDAVSPVIYWRYLDNVSNAREQQWRLASLPRVGGSGTDYAYRTGDSATRTAEYVTGVATLSFPEDARYDEINWNRGDKSDANRVEGLSSSNAFPWFDVVIQDQPIGYLDSDVHDYAQGKAVAGQICIESTVDAMVDAFHELRQKNLPTFFCWSAMQPAGGWATPGTADETGIPVTATTLTNIFDGTTARTAVTEGLTCHGAYLAGRGAEGKDDGKKVPTTVAAYLDPGTSDLTVRFQGPDHIANNWVDIVATGGTALALYWGGSKLYLNSSVEDTDTSTGRNKVDILAKVGSGGDTGYIYGFNGFGSYLL